jgi:2-phospho-L-lactate transferase/gluconeogenesis factor (CofD/UPF0052 family)
MIGATAISGPAHKLMTASGLESSVLGVACCYADFLDALMIADEDRSFMPAIEQLQVRVVASDIRMPDLTAKRRLARGLLALARK